MKTVEDRHGQSGSFETKIVSFVSTRGGTRSSWTSFVESLHDSAYSTEHSNYGWSEDSKSTRRNRAHLISYKS